MYKQFKNLTQRNTQRGIMGRINETQNQEELLFLKENFHNMTNTNRLTYQKQPLNANVIQVVGKLIAERDHKERVFSKIFGIASFILAVIAYFVIYALFTTKGSPIYAGGIDKEDLIFISLFLACFLFMSLNLILPLLASNILHFVYARKIREILKRRI